MSISFRVMRLVRPQPHTDSNVKLDLLQDTQLDSHRDGALEADLKYTQLSKGLVSQHRSMRSHAETFSDLQAPSDLLALPSSFGSTYLGETFRACVVASNVASSCLSRVAIKIELAAERHTTVLYDNTEDTVQELQPSENIQAIIKQDIKDLGNHTLTCSATFTSEQGDRTLYSQTFRFSALAPLTVRTKVRAAGPLLLLEATVDNCLKGPLLLHSTRFLPAPGLAARQLQVSPPAAPAAPAADEPLASDAQAGEGGSAADAPRQRGPLDQYISGLNMVPARGSCNLLFGLTRSTGSSSSSSDGDGRGSSNVLGRMELRWSGMQAEAGRLQTQPILGTPASLPKQLVAELKHVPATVRLEQPFTVHFTLTNNTAQATGPLTIGVPHFSTAGMASSSGASGSELPELVVCGRPSVSVASLAAGASAVVQLSMVGLQLGFVRSPALLLQQGAEAQPLDCIPEFVVMVEPG